MKGDRVFNGTKNEMKEQTQKQKSRLREVKESKSKVCKSRKLS